MVKPKASKSQKKATRKSVASKPTRHPNLKKGRPDIRVKRSAYSKTARVAVLASAQARAQLIEMGGENTIDVIREFDRDMSDEELARKTGIKASDVRVVLNRLHSIGLFSYTRVRDRDSGWYSYIWKMSEGRLRDFVGSEAEARMDGPAPAEVQEAPDEGYLEKNLVGLQMQNVERRRR